jgi:hypothetical protein
MLFVLPRDRALATLETLAGGNACCGNSGRSDPKGVLFKNEQSAVPPEVTSACVAA